MTDWVVERLERVHQRSSFSCGKPMLDEFLHRLVSQYERRNLGRTYVAVRPPEKTILAYYTLASGAIHFQNLPRRTANKLPNHPVPVIKLARLAVERTLQGQGFGEAMLIDALQRCHSIANQLGIYAIEVDAIDEQAQSFYEKYGFEPLLDNPLHMFLPIATIKSMLGSG